MRKNDLELDLIKCDWIQEKVQASNTYAQNLYAALCNNSFIKKDSWDILSEQYWSCSWRHAASIVAMLKQEGDYMDWYCSGGSMSMDLGGTVNIENVTFMPEGEVSQEIQQDLDNLGWLIYDLDR